MSMTVTQRETQLTIQLQAIGRDIVEANLKLSDFQAQGYVGSDTITKLNSIERFVREHNRNLAETGSYAGGVLPRNFFYLHPKEAKGTAELAHELVVKRSFLTHLNTVIQCVEGRGSASADKVQQRALDFVERRQHKLLKATEHFELTRHYWAELGTPREITSVFTAKDANGILNRRNAKVWISTHRIGEANVGVLWIVPKTHNGAITIHKGTFNSGMRNHWGVSEVSSPFKLIQWQPGCAHAVILGRMQPNAPLRAADAQTDCAPGNTTHQRYENYETADITGVLTTAVSEFSSQALKSPPLAPKQVVGWGAGARSLLLDYLADSALTTPLVLVHPQTRLNSGSPRNMQHLAEWMGPSIHERLPDFDVLAQETFWEPRDLKVLLLLPPGADQNPRTMAPSKTKDLCEQSAGLGEMLRNKEATVTEVQAPADLNEDALFNAQLHAPVAKEWFTGTA